MKRHYLSYLLRLWHTSDQDESNWSASLEDPHTRQVTYFRSLAGLWQYLQDRIAPGSDVPQDHSNETGEHNETH